MNASWKYSNEGQSLMIACDDGAYQNCVINGTPSVEKPIIISQEEKAETPYGPLPCCAIEKICVRQNTNGNLTVFTGGMPKAQFSDCFVVTVMQGENRHVCFKFGSPVVDFVLLDEQSEALENGEHQVEKVQFLVVLTENELSVIDLKSEGWPQLSNPYLSCLSLSKVTAISHVKDVTKEQITNLMNSNDWLGSPLNESLANWPFSNGEKVSSLEEFTSSDILSLGHENGLISLWILGKGDSVAFLGMVSVQQLFASENDTILSAEEESWPPFRKIGICSLLSVIGPCNNAVQTLKIFKTQEDVEIICGTKLGNIIWWSTKSNETFNSESDCIIVNFNADSKYGCLDDSIEMLTPHQNQLGFSQFMNNAIKPKCLIQVLPVAPITCIVVEPAWNLLAFGCGIGHCLMCIKSYQILDKGFMPEIIGNTPTPVVSTKEKPTLLNKGRMLKGNLRQSFKKFKSFTQSTSENHPEEVKKDDQSQSDTKDQPEEAVTEASKEATNETDKDSIIEADKKATTESGKETEKETTSVEGKVVVEENKAEKQDDKVVQIYPLNPLWSITTINFANTYIDDSQTIRPLMLVGTNGGNVYFYDLSECLNTDSALVKCKLLKEIQLHHGASVLGLYAYDAKCRESVPLKSLDDFKVAELKEELSKATEEEPKAESTNGTVAEVKEVIKHSHTLLLVSKEQAKVFSLPLLKPMYKYKFSEMKSLIQHSVNAGGDQKCDTDISRHVLACSLQQLSCRSGETKKWVLTAALSDGSISILSVGKLRRLAKICLHNCANMITSQVISDDSLVLRSINGQIYANEVSVHRRLHPVVWETVEVAKEANAEKLDEKDVVETDALHNGTEKLSEDTSSKAAEESAKVFEKAEELSAEPIKGGNFVNNIQVNNDLDKTELSFTNGTQDVGDITMDTVKDYLNNDGVVTVKTTESSMEKRTVIKDGDVMTTLREIEKQDGKVLKDDIVKVSSVVQNVE